MPVLHSEPEHENGSFSYNIEIDSGPHDVKKDITTGNMIIFSMLSN